MNCSKRFEPNHCHLPIGKTTDHVSGGQLLAAHPKVPALQADLKPGGGRFKRANYLSLEILYDRGNEWSNYFEKEFLR